MRTPLVVRIRYNIRCERAAGYFHRIGSLGQISANQIVCIVNELTFHQLSACREIEYSRSALVRSKNAVGHDGISCLFKSNHSSITQIVPRKSAVIHLMDVRSLRSIVGDVAPTQISIKRSRI